MLKRFKKFWEQMTQTDTPLVSKAYVEKTIHLLYWLGLFVAIAGFIAGIISGIVVFSFVVFFTVTLYGLGIWLALIVVCCFLTLGVLKVNALEKGTKQKQEEKKTEEKEEKKDA